MSRKTPKAYIYRRMYQLPTIPENGWLQCCYMCDDTLTGNTIFYKLDEDLKLMLKSDMKFEVYLCSQCEYNCNSNPEIKQQFNARIRSYIQRNFISIYQ
jgi:hypothetical protein